MRNQLITEKTWQTQQQATAAGKKHETGKRRQGSRHPPAGAWQGRNCCRGSAGLLSALRRSCGLLALATLLQLSLVFNKQDASAQADSFPVTPGRGVAWVLLIAPGPLVSLPWVEWLQVHPGQSAMEGMDLSPSCSPLLMSKTRSMWYRLGCIGEEKLSFHLAHFLLVHLKAVIKEMVVLRLGTKGTSKLLTFSLVCSAALMCHGMMAIGMWIA